MNAMISVGYDRNDKEVWELIFDCVSPMEVLRFFYEYDSKDDFMNLIEHFEVEILLSNNFNGERYTRTYSIYLNYPYIDNSFLEDREWIEFVRDKIIERMDWE